MKKLYAEICKTEEIDDGTIKVWGYASSGAVDSDGDTITPEAMKAALPDYLKFGAVREMHQPKAAGTAIEADVQEDGRTFFGAHVVDSEACRKVKANVYKGFSIGGNVTQRDDTNKSIIKGIKLIEISLVDRPANPQALFTMYKVEEVNNSVDELAELIDKGSVTVEELIEFAKTNRLKPEVELTKAEVLGNISKYAGEEIYNVSTAIQALDSIFCLLLREMSSSDEPPEQIAALQAACANLKAFIASEIQEDNSDDDRDMMIMSDKPGDLQKKGAQFSASVKDKLAKAHEAIKTASGHMDSLDYSNSEKADAADDSLAKLSKLQGENDKLTRRVQELEVQPEPAKGNLRIVEKAADAPITEEEDDSALDKNLSPEDAALKQIRKIHQTGGRPLSQL